MTRPIAEIDLFLGKRLRKLRTAQKLTQKRFAEFVGVSLQQVQKHENGRKPISGTQLQKMIEILDVSLDAFLGVGSRTGPFFETETAELLQLFNDLNPPMRARVLKLIKLVARED